MPRKTFLLLISLVVLPLSAFAWLGWRAAKGEEARIEQDYRQLFEARLTQENAKLARYFDEQRRQLARIAQQCRDDSSALRAWVRQSPVVRQTFVLDRQGELVHPGPQSPMSRAERAFLLEIQPLLDDKDLVRAAFGPDGRSAMQAAAGSAKLASSVAPPPSPRNAAPLVEPAMNHVDLVALTESVVPPIESSQTRDLADDGWYVWYFGRGAHLLYWHRWNDERVTLVALSRPRWMSDLLSVLPDSPSDSRPTSSRAASLSRTQPPIDAAAWQIRLVDSADQTVYQWGDLVPAEGEDASAELTVGAPLSAWRLKYFTRTNSSPYSRLPVWAGMCSLAAGLLGLAFILHRDYSRDMREASQRVNFVNQVSHELKTPLTNIRMYADLLAMDLDGLPDADVAKPRRRLEVIIGESQRLTRLIANVLSFASSERNPLKVYPRLTQVDELIRSLLQRFGPALEAAGVAVTLDLQLPDPVYVDSDMIQQIVGNLVSNVLNYAADGGHLSVQTSRAGELLEIIVSDRGPGIPAALARNLFQPFVRGSNRLSDATGTGIGLSISRRLAQEHGGDVVIQPSSRGATFRVTIRAAPAAPLDPQDRHQPS